MAFDWKHDIKQFLVAGIPGCVAKTCIAPLDRIKILLQAQHPYYKDYGVFRCFPEIIRREGFTALWKGNTMMLLRIYPYSAIQFYSVEKYATLYQTIFGPWHLNNLFAGSTAGVTCILCTYPLDMVRARLAYQITGEQKYLGIRSAFSQIYKNEGGMFAFFRGLSASILGMVPYAGISFYTFRNLKDIAITKFPETFGRKDHYSDKIVLRNTYTFIFGLLAGAFSQTATFPLDVARRRMQLANDLPDPHKFSRVWSTLRAVYNQDGIRRGLYRGLTINYLRICPQQAVSFTTWELLQQFFEV